MREILFRGKTPIDDDFCGGEWVQGFYTCFNGTEHRIYSGYAETDCGDYYPDWYEVIPKTVGQYTGLTDKNGTRIFEGDIVRIHERTMNGSDIGIVQYNAPKFVIVVHQKEIGWSYFHDIVESNTMQDMQAAIRLNYDYEVIGNIHDNPELLI